MQPDAEAWINSGGSHPGQTISLGSTRMKSVFNFEPDVEGKRKNVAVN